MKVVVDFETYYSDEYSLRKMHMLEYIHSEEFKVHGASIKIENQEAKWFDGDILADKFALIPWRVVDLICHNTAFDGYILKHRYGWFPNSYIDTMAMSRALYGSSIKSHSLGSVYETVTGMKGKLKNANLADVKGKRDLSRVEAHALGQYARDDADQTWAIYNKLQHYFPQVEYARMDTVLRMFIDPKLMLDEHALDEAEQQEIDSKEELLERLAPYGVTRETLMSNDKFKLLLESRGVDVPIKVSEKTGKSRPDFAKASKAFTDLEFHDDPVVGDMVRARLRVKSTLAETRARRYADVARATGGKFPVPLNYAGAMQTHRLSGGMKMNPQNLGRGSPLRYAIHAPEGHKLVVIDLSNIELRTNMTMCRQLDAVYDLSEGVDLYCKFASRLFGVEVNKKDNPDERTVGKVAELSLGYGSGSKTFRSMLWTQAGMDRDLDFCQNVVDIYRDTHPQVKNMWYRLNDCLDYMVSGIAPENPTAAPVTFGKASIRLPSGLHIKYPELSKDFNEDTGRYEITFKRLSRANPSGRGRIYGAMVCENLNQALAREVLSDMQDRIFAATEVRPSLQVHDELVFVVPEAKASDFFATAESIMSTPPDWWPELPVACEGAIVTRYGDAK